MHPCVRYMKLSGLYLQQERCKNLLAIVLKTAYNQSIDRFGSCTVSWLEERKHDNMSLTNEDLLAISNIVQLQVDTVRNDIRDIKILLENDIEPRVQNIEACYTSTYRRYAGGINQLEAIQSDVDILKKVVAEHSEKLQRLA